MEGFLQMRFPETLNSSRGMHFIDHHRPDMRPLSILDPFPEWKHNADTGELCYRVSTKEGVEFGGRARPGVDAVDMEFRVKNVTNSPLVNVINQMCLVLAHAPQFGKPLDLSPCHTWVDGRFISLDNTTPTPEQRKQKPWILMLTRDLARTYAGPREWPERWWMVDQVADHNILARMSDDRKHLVAIAWDDPASQLMTNTMIPCLHAGPMRAAALKPGEETIWRGKIYLMANDPPELLARYNRDALARFGERTP